MSRVTFLGGGSFGSALAVLLAEKENIVNIYNRDRKVVDEINIKRTNEKYMKDLIIPENVTAFGDIPKAVEGADYIVLSVPSHVIRSMCRSI
ncbi:MAG: NAD(P)-binding domain-containing protein, partial [Clostridium sp.]|nr:NAD(P)-binding domain-containing protein [Clostridium sp.]